MDFCSLLNKDYFIPSSLYKKADKYILLVEFPVEMDNSQIITFMITAEEYGAEMFKSEIRRVLFVRTCEVNH